MAIQVHVGFSRKVGEANYSSRGASVQIELELEQSTHKDFERLQAAVEGIFIRARQAVDRRSRTAAAHQKNAAEMACVRR